MERRPSGLRVCLTLLSFIVLLAGLGSAMLIYRAAEDDSNGVLGYREEGGSVYPVMPDESKKYLRDMELYGGKANVIADEFRRWLEGLWQGKSLAYIVASASLLLATGLFYAAVRHRPT